MNIKELKKLSLEVSKASQFATQIQERVQGDLERIKELDSFVSETKSVILDLEEKVRNANAVLTKLNSLLG
jgi:hypothetical protein